MMEKGLANWEKGPCRCPSGPEMVLLIRESMKKVQSPTLKRAYAPLCATKV